MRQSFILSFVFCFPLATVGCQNRQHAAVSSTMLRANPESPRMLGDFKVIEGTSYLMAAIYSEAKIESTFKSGSHNDLHNHYFLNTKDESARQLLPTNDFVIENTFRLPEENQNAKEPVAVKWFLYYLIKDDSDGDAKLTHKDTKVLAISDSSGAGYAELIKDVEHVYGQVLSDPDTLLIAYRSGSKKYSARLDLISRKVVSTRELSNLGADVQ